MIEPLLDPDVINSEIDLLVAAIHIDRYVMDAMDRLEEDFEEIHSLTMQTFKQLSNSKHLLNDKILCDKEVPNEGVSRNLEEITVYNELMEKKADTPVARLRRLCACCDRSYSYYSTISKCHADKVVRSTAEKLAASADERSKTLKQALGKECGCDDTGSCVIR